MKIKTLVVGPLAVNCYIVYEDGVGAVIDPGADSDKISGAVSELDIKVTHIINTHGHFDHIGANRILKEKTGADILIHGSDAELLAHAELSAARFGLTADPSPEPDRLLKDGDRISSGNIEFKVIHTPGHSPGGICLLAKNFLITGDTLFAGSIGRTDLPGGSYDQLLASVRSGIFTLDPSIEIYPGHGPASTIGNEKAYNPFFAASSFSLEG